jgi:hypothetical protein
MEAQWPDTGYRLMGIARPTYYDQRAISQYEQCKGL